jgi:hypothetical protein
MNKIYMLLILGLLITVCLFIFEDKTTPIPIAPITIAAITTYENNICTLSPDVYTNPNFYPNYEFYINKTHDYSRWATEGFGAYPAFDSYILAPNISTIKICTLVRTGWEVETYQGVHFVSSYNENLFNITVFPDTILLAPVFPEFVNNWTQKIMFTVTLQQKIVPGTYKFKVSTTSPPHQSQEYANSIPTNKVYISSGAFQADRFFDFEIVVP